MIFKSYHGGGKIEICVVCFLSPEPAMGWNSWPQKRDIAEAYSFGVYIKPRQDMECGGTCKQKQQWGIVFYQICRSDQLCLKGGPVNGISIDIAGAGRAEPLPQAHRLEDCACLQMRMASRAVTRLFDKIIEPTGLKATQFSFLAAIDEAGPATFSGLAAQLVMDSSTVARNLKPLEKAGLIFIEPAEDRRCKIVNLTPKGTLKLAESMPFWYQAHEVLQDMVGSETLNANSKNLRKFVDSIAERPLNGTA